MKIAQVSLRYMAPGGVEYHVFHLSRELTKLGNEVEVFTTDLYVEKPWQKITKNEDYLSPVKVNRYRAYKNLIPLLKMPIAPEMVEGLMEYSPDIIHLHSHRYFHLLFGGLLSSRYPIVITTHFHPPEKKESYRTRALLNFQDLLFRAFVYQHASAIISHSKVEVNEMKHFMNHININIIPPGIEPSDFSYNYNGASFTELYDIKGKYIIYVGRIASNKGLIPLVRAFKEVLKRLPELTLVIMGEDNGFKDKVAAEIIKLGIDKNIIFTGYVPDKSLYLELIKNSELLVLPSEWEAFGIVVLEAYMLHRPVVTSDRGGLKELGKIGGLTTSYGNVEQLSSAIKHVLMDGELAEKLGRRGYEKTISEYTWEAVAKRVNAVYKAVYE